jgi:hypothetical protein
MMGRQRILADLSGGRPDRVSVILYNFLMALARADVLSNDASAAARSSQRPAFSS